MIQQLHRETNLKDETNRGQNETHNFNTWHSLHMNTPANVFITNKYPQQ